MTCQDAGRLIAAYVDGELDGARRLAVERHLTACGDCRNREADLQTIGELLRATAALTPTPIEDLRGLAAGVVSRIGAEDEQSFRAKCARAFEDWHWVAVGSGAFSAAFATVFVVFALLYAPVTQARQLNAPAGTLYLMAVPEDGRGEPVLLEYERSLGSASGDPRYAMPASFGWMGEQALVAALDKSLMRYGAAMNYRDLSAEGRDEIGSLLREIARLRDAVPARRPAGVTRVSGMHLHVSEVVTGTGL